MKIGKPKYEGSQKNYFSFKKGVNRHVLRILPPLGNLADAGKWNMYYKVEYGHVGTDGRMKAFQSVRKVDFKTKMVEVESECHLRREKIQQKLEAAKEAGDAEAIETCKKLLGKYNLDKKYYMNAIDLEGNIGLFKIGYKGFQALRDKIDKLKAEGVDPIGVDDGRFFVFARSGTGLDTVYTADEYKQKVQATIDGEVVAVEKSVPHSLTDEIISRLGSEAFELDSLFPEITPEEESRIVHEGPVAVDEILGKKKEEPKKEAAPVAKAETPAPTPESTPEPVVEAKVEAPVAETVDTTTGEITETPAASAESSDKGIADMSDEEFLASLG